MPRPVGALSRGRSVAGACADLGLPRRPVGGVRSASRRVPTRPPLRRVHSTLRYRRRRATYQAGCRCRRGRRQDEPSATCAHNPSTEVLQGRSKSRRALGAQYTALLDHGPAGLERRSRPGPSTPTRRVPRSLRDSPPISRPTKLALGSPSSTCFRTPSESARRRLGAVYAGCSRLRVLAHEAGIGCIIVALRPTRRRHSRRRDRGAGRAASTGRAVAPSSLVRLRLTPLPCCRPPFIDRPRGYASCQSLPARPARRRTAVHTPDGAAAAPASARHRLRRARRARLALKAELARPRRPGAPQKRRCA